MRWYGHVRRREEEGHLLERAVKVEIKGIRPAVRPKKTRRQCLKEDIREKEREHDHHEFLLFLFFSGVAFSVVVGCFEEPLG